MDITLISIAFFILLAIVLVLIFLFRSINKKSFKAEDGSVFETHEDLHIYQNLYDKTKPLFSIDEENGSKKSILGFDNSFLTKLTNLGFNDLKTLVRYRKQIKLLSDLINTKI